MFTIEYLQPDLVLGSSICSLTKEILQQHNIKGLVLDVDETLVPTQVTEASEILIEWIEEIRQETKLFLVSNNLSQDRIGNIAESLNIPYILGARKPSRKKLRQAIAQMELPVKEIAMVGDRLFTDVIVGNRLGMFTILVQPMVDPSIAIEFYPTHTLEVWISKMFGVSLSSVQHKFIESDESLKK